MRKQRALSQKYKKRRHNKGGTTKKNKTVTMNEIPDIKIFDLDIDERVSKLKPLDEINKLKSTNHCNDIVIIKDEFTNNYKYTFSKKRSDYPCRRGNSIFHSPEEVEQYVLEYIEKKKQNKTEKAEHYENIRNEFASVNKTLKRRNKNANSTTRSIRRLPKLNLEELALETQREPVNVTIQTPEMNSTQDSTSTGNANIIEDDDDDTFKLPPLVRTKRIRNM